MPIKEQVTNASITSKYLQAKNELDNILRSASKYNNAEYVSEKPIINAIILFAKIRYDEVFNALVLKRSPELIDYLTNCMSAFINDMHNSMIGVWICSAEFQSGDDHNTIMIKAAKSRNSKKTTWEYKLSLFSEQDPGIDEKVAECRAYTNKRHAELNRRFLKLLQILPEKYHTLGNVCMYELLEDEWNEPYSFDRMTKFPTAIECSGIFRDRITSLKNHADQLRKKKYQYYPEYWYTRMPINPYDLTSDILLQAKMEEAPCASPLPMDYNSIIAMITVWSLDNFEYQISMTGLAELIERFALTTDGKYHDLLHPKTRSILEEIVFYLSRSTI